MPSSDQKIILNDSKSEEEGTLTHDFEFLNLEFVKPTRMSKVYICFASNIMENDLLYCVFHIPTVGICRAEQRVKACSKLVRLGTLCVAQFHVIERHIIFDTFCRDIFVSGEP